MSESFIKRLKAGEQSAFEELVDAYEKKIFQSAFRFLSDRELAADATQEVFLKIYRGISSFKEESQLSTWIYRVTFNTCMDMKAKQKRTPEILSSTEDGEPGLERFRDHAPTPEESALLSEDREAIRRAISALSEEQRTVIVLRDVEGRSYQEIAGLLKLSEGTVKSRINRARARLQALLFPLRNFSCVGESKKANGEKGGGADEL